jgi:hypothetical protein
MLGRMRDHDHDLALGRGWSGGDRGRRRRKEGREGGYPEQQMPSHIADVHHG